MRPPIRPLTDSRSRAGVGRPAGASRTRRVTQPSPVPLRQRGTPSVTLAAHSTRVPPNSTSTEPSAWSSQFRVMVTGRSWSAQRSSRRAMRQTLCLQAPHLRTGGRRKRQRARGRMELGHGHPGGPWHQVVGAPTEPGTPSGPTTTRPPTCSAAGTQGPAPGYVDLQPMPGEFVGERPGQCAVAAFARAQSVDAPEVPAVHLRVVGHVQPDPAELRAQVVERRLTCSICRHSGGRSHTGRPNTWPWSRNRTVSSSALRAVSSSAHRYRQSGSGPRRRWIAGRR